MQLDITKQQIIVNGETVLRRSARIFNECEDINEIIIVTRSDELDFARETVKGLSKVKHIVVGGNTRHDSARVGFLAIDGADYVAVHDAARCLVTCDIISKVISDAKIYGAATASTRITDTVKRADKNGSISETVDRNELRAVQTPQVFRYELYSKAIELVTADEAITDDNSLLEKIGVFSHLTETGKNNIKLTTPEDLSFAAYLLNGENNE
jgi:2-C-methyl-D-erythritol 4-phosphate cytidylyltransferase